MGPGVEPSGPRPFLAVCLRSADRSFRHGRLRWSGGVWLLACALLAGCAAAATHVEVSTPRRVPAGAIAIVGAVPVTTASFEHWRTIISRDPAESGQAPRRTVSFLVRAQWLLQEAVAEGIDKSVLDRLARQRAANVRQSGMTLADALLQARLDVIGEALQSRHSTASVTTAEVARYYAGHRSQFHNPAVRDTLMIITRDRASALRARAALRSGKSWAVEARRWSIDPSALGGGAYAVVEGVQSAALVHAVFAAPRGRLTGPVRATTLTQPGVSYYYLFKVSGGQPASPQPLAQASERVRRTLTEQERKRSLAAFTRAYEQRWRSRTLCATNHLVAECRND